MHRSHEKGMNVTHSEPITKTPHTATGLFAMLCACFDARGGCAPSARHAPLALTLTISALGLLALSSATPAPASPPITFAGEGSGAGQVERPNSVAVNQSDGDLYITDYDNARIDEFNGAGGFVRAFGYGVLNHSNEFQTCTAATKCENGVGGQAAGQFFVPDNVAVDNSGGPSNGDLYATQDSGGEGYRVQRFDAEGKFLLMFGKGVDRGPHHPGNVCRAEYIAEGDACGSGVQGVGEGEILSRRETPAHRRWLWQCLGRRLQSYRGVLPGRGI